MQCHEFESRAHELLDARFPPADDPAIADHAAQCPACRAALSDLTSLIETVAVHPRPVGRADLAARVLTDLRAHPRKPAARWVVLATAASLLVAAAVAIWSVVDQRPVANTSPVSKFPPAAVDNQPPNAAATTDLSGTLSDAWLLAPGISAVESPSADDPATSGWGGELAAGLSPLADSTADAWDFLMTALPGADGTGPNGSAPPDAAPNDET
jgi:hypothetical protein